MLNIKAFALACGIFWAVSVVLFAFLAATTGICQAFVDLMANCYPGYGATLQGALIGAVWALADGLVCGAIFSWLYNLCAKKVS